MPDTRSENVRVAVIAAISAIGAALLTATFTYTSRSRELDIEFVKIGISILRVDPKEAQTNGAREWAIQIIEDYSKVRFSREAKSELLQHRWLSSGYVDYYEPGYDCTFTAEGKLIGCKSEGRRVEPPVRR
jgi:hypothetical protein